MPYNNILYATEQEARNYYLTPSSQALFMDPSAPTFYFKTVDAFGQPDFIIADFTIRNQQPPQDNPPLTRADLDSFKQEILALISQQQPQGGNAHDNQPQSVDAQQQLSNN
jgi:hypothetical protein